MEREFHPIAVHYVSADPKVRPGMLIEITMTQLRTIADLLDMVEYWLQQLPANSFYINGCLIQAGIRSPSLIKEDIRKLRDLW